MNRLYAETVLKVRRNIIHTLSRSSEEQNILNCPTDETLNPIYSAKMFLALVFDFCMYCDHTLGQGSLEIKDIYFPEHRKNFSASELRYEKESDK
jgi:hypothetical protein